MIGKLCLHTTLSHEESPGFQDSPTLLGHWKLRSRLLCTGKRDPLPSNSLATLQITFCNLFFFKTKNLIPALDSFIVISCTVECTLLVNEQIVIRLKKQNWTIQNWGRCSCAQAMTMPTPLPSKKNVQTEPLEMIGCVIQTVTTPFCKLRTSNASECTRVKT